MSIVTEFNDYRERMNEKILKEKNTVLKRLFNLDTNAFAEGALDVQTKELIGLSTSMVLRCDDCVKYHLGKCNDIGLSTDQIFEVFSIANLIGGTVVIPHLRRAMEYWEALQKEE